MHPSLNSEPKIFFYRSVKNFMFVLRFFGPVAKPQIIIENQKTQGSFQKFKKPNMGQKSKRIVEYNGPFLKTQLAFPSPISNIFPRKVFVAYTCSYVNVFL